MMAPGAFWAKMNDGAASPAERYFLHTGATAMLRYLSEVAYECGTAEVIQVMGTLAQVSTLAQASPLPTAVEGAIQEVCQPPVSSPVLQKSIG